MKVGNTIEQRKTVNRNKMNKILKSNLFKG